MINELFQLRHHTYRAAGEVHHACGKYFATLSKRGEGENQEAAQQVHTAAERYKATLDELLAHLRSAKPDGIYAEEVRRTEQTIEILDREVALIFHL